MTHVSCSSCRLRFARALAAHLAECPLCGTPLDRSTTAAPTLGYSLFDADSPEPQGAAHAAPPRALADAISVPVRP